MRGAATLCAALFALVICCMGCNGCNRAPSERPGPSMHGYTLASFGDFTHDWRLVTARYRQDIGEQRFTYANAAAMKVLAQGGTHYPDGAMFGKVGFIVEEDKIFPSSLVPSGSRRYQFMVRDEQRFKDTNGWGYVIFSSIGATLPGDPGQTSQACAACHSIVGEQGYVFSQPMKLEPATDEGAPRDPHPPSERVAVTFTDRDVARLPPNVARLLPAGVARVRALQGEVRDHLFSGTLNELRPVLTEEALAKGLPALVLADDPIDFELVWQDAADNAPCPRKGVRARYAISGKSPKAFAPLPVQSESLLREGSFCFERT